MLEFLSATARQHIRVLLAGVLALSAGLGAVPNLNQSHAVGIAALCAALAMVGRGLTAYVPRLSVAHYIGSPVGDWIDAFLHAGLGTFIVLGTGWLDAPNLANWRTAWSAIIVGALAAGAHAVQDLLTKSKYPAPGFGLAAPAKP